MSHALPYRARVVLEAADDVASGFGTPGSDARRKHLERAVDAATAADPDLALLVAAVLWLDRYGRAGAPGYAHRLEAVAAARRAGR